MDKILALGSLLFLCLLFTSSCSSLSIEGGVAFDRGQYKQHLPPFDGEVQEGRGNYLGISYFLKNNQNSFGVGSSAHLFGYADDFDGDPIFVGYTDVKYRFLFSKNQEKPRVGLTFGGGPGINSHFEFKVASIFGEVSLHTKYNELYLLLKNRAIWNTSISGDVGNFNNSLQLGLGINF